MKSRSLSRFRVVGTEHQLQCFPTTASIRRFFIAGVVALVLFSVAILVLPLALVSDPALRLGAIAFSVLAVVLFWGVCAAVGVKFWKHRNTPLIADKDRGHLMFGKNWICALDDIQSFETMESRGGEHATTGEEEPYRLAVRLRSGSSIPLPLWFAAGTSTEAERLLTTLAEFIGVDANIET